MHRMGALFMGLHYFQITQGLIVNYSLQMLITMYLNVFMVSCRNLSNSDKLYTFIDVFMVICIYELL